MSRVVLLFMTVLGTACALKADMASAKDDDPGSLLGVGLSRMMHPRHKAPIRLHKSNHSKNDEDKDPEPSLLMGGRSDGAEDEDDKENDEDEAPSLLGSRNSDLDPNNYIWGGKLPYDSESFAAKVEAGKEKQIEKEKRNPPFCGCAGGLSKGVCDIEWLEPSWTQLLGYRFPRDILSRTTSCDKLSETLQVPKIEEGTTCESAMKTFMSSPLGLKNFIKFNGCPSDAVVKLKHSKNDEDKDPEPSLLMGGRSDGAEDEDDKEDDEDEVPSLPGSRNIDKASNDTCDCKNFMITLRRMDPDDVKTIRTRFALPKFMLGLNDNACVNNYVGIEPGTWCFVDSSCSNLNGGQHVFKGLSSKNCEPGQDTMLRSYSPEMLANLSEASRPRVDLPTLYKLAYSSATGHKWQDVSIYWNVSWATVREVPKEFEDVYPKVWGDGSPRNATQEWRDHFAASMGINPSFSEELLNMTRAVKESNQMIVFDTNTESKPPVIAVKGHKVWFVESSNYFCITGC